MPSAAIKSVLLIFFAAGGFLLAGCRSATLETSRAGVTAAASNAKSISIDNAPVEKRAEAFARFATGISYELNDKPDLALQEFYKSALADPSNEALALDLSRRFLKKKQPEKVVAILSNSASRSRASGNIFSWLGRAYLVLGKTNLALNASRSAVRKSPDLISGYQVLNEILLRTGATREAIKLLNNAARSTNRDALFLVSLGELYGDILSARPSESDAVNQAGLKVLHRAVALKPTNPNLRQELADAFAQLGDTKSAAKIYLQLLDEFHDMDLMRDALREKLANLYLRSRDQKKAAEQLEAVVRDSPTRYPEAWYYLGAFAHDARDYAKAAEYFNRALIVKPDFERVYYELAGMQINMNQSGEALKTLEKARQKFRNTFSLEFLTGLANAHLKNYSEALNHFSAAEMIGNTSESNRLTHHFYFQVGAACERNHDYPQAEKYFQKCLAMAPDFSDALNYLGFMWADRGENLEKARALIEKAVKLEPKNAAYLDSLGWVLFKLNRYEDALGYLLQAIHLSDEPDAAIYDHVGDVYLALKQEGKARQAWQKSLTLEPNDAVRKKLQTNASAL